MALEEIRGDVTLAELAAKHGVHRTMIASWKRQSGGGDEARAVSESEEENCTPRSGNWSWSGICQRKALVDERRPEAGDGRTCSPPPVGLDRLAAVEHDGCYAFTSVLRDAE